MATKKNKATLLKRNWITGGIMSIVLPIIGIGINVWLKTGGPDNWILYTVLYALSFGCFASPIGLLVMVIKENNYVNRIFCECGKNYDFEQDVAYRIVDLHDDSVTKISISSVGNDNYTGESYTQRGKQKARVAIRCHCHACGRQAKEFLLKGELESASDWHLERWLREYFNPENCGLL